MILQKYQTKGVATKALELAEDRAFSELGIGLVAATVHPNNSASIRVLKKRGFVFQEKGEDARGDYFLFTKVIEPRNDPSL